MALPKTPNESSEPIVIIGGSIAALMSGIVLTRLGYNVRVLEQNESSVREEKGAGITVGPDAQEFFSKYDQVPGPYAVPCPGVNFLDANSKVKQFMKRPMLMSTWSALYYRLRANFDGYKSSFCPDPPASAQNQGKAVLQMGAKVTNVADTDGQVTVTYIDKAEGTEHSIKSDLVIAADGASSAIRRILLPDAEPLYSGYLGWRGLVPESEMSEESREILSPEFTGFTYKGGYILCYIVPSSDGNLEVGHRRFNWVWYSKSPPQSSAQYAEIMTDSDGWKHRNSVPKGKMREDVWNAQREYGTKILNSVFVELINKTKEPFLSVIQDFAAPQASFFDGKLLMLGDALAVFRPHMALSLNQAAVDNLLLEKLIKGEITTKSWEKQVVQYGRRNRLINIAFGNFYLYGGLTFAKSVVAYLLSLLPFQSLILAAQRYFRR
ncbi:uncharacterized protein BP5553_01675 [Venustampulla echinocandica]|uniref:2,6-dihydroxypyridine 3-monooxygenase substrate binding domain-containing protein n=1 Tax=Venustampulla echinocandica TaxID=2656787 RepID=A0A370U1N7_9HELO|nr:uncharacterized protein BP5553_01675 [Venustampulla echinocandica]RDL41696.1 hypothetical protein BP5553_01675 [Venustampulla echinocandica]